MNRSSFLKHIFIYPVKSLGSVSLEIGMVKERGLRFDRRWMLVDDQGDFITQRENPLMADILCKITGDNFEFYSKSGRSLKHMLPMDFKGGPTRIMTQIWGGSVEASLAGKIHDQFFSEAIGQSCRLVFMDPETRRNGNRFMTAGKTEVSFADAYPYLIIGRESLDDLNNRLENPVDIGRFRPNLVIEGFDPFEEDGFKEIRIGKIRFQIAKTCPRCAITTIDPETYEKGKEPLATLAKYRTIENQVMFGVNAFALDYGKIHLNDKVEILK